MPLRKDCQCHKNNYNAYEARFHALDGLYFLLPVQCRREKSPNMRYSISSYAIINRVTHRTSLLEFTLPTVSAREQVVDLPMKYTKYIMDNLSRGTSKHRAHQSYCLMWLLDIFDHAEITENQEYE